MPEPRCIRCGQPTGLSPVVYAPLCDPCERLERLRPGHVPWKPSQVLVQPRPASFRALFEALFAGKLLRCRETDGTWKQRGQPVGKTTLGLAAMDLYGLVAADA